jgi:Zn-dependent M28 family amino/carboxypeptidase
MDRFLVVLVVLLVVFPACADTTDNIKGHTEYLSADRLGGRGTGSQGIKLAADYIATQFGEIGLNQLPNGSYLQSFNIPGQDTAESNVVGYIISAKPTTRSIVFTAHYDAFGVIEKEGQEDVIYNGALDNAVGVGALIELARLYKSAGAPEQNLIFIATAAEEVGQFGAEHYLSHPLFPLEDITLNLNFDGFNVSGLRTDYFIMPRQGIAYAEQIKTVGSTTGWLYQSPGWEDQMNKKFDSATFLAKGIPALTLWIGNRMNNGEQALPTKFGAIHSPDDEINPFWDWTGVEDHLNLYKSIADYYLENGARISVSNPELFHQDK